MQQRRYRRILNTSEVNKKMTERNRTISLVCTECGSSDIISEQQTYDDQEYFFYCNKCNSENLEEYTEYY